MELVTAICAGVGLAAACGFRVFLPLLAAGIAIRSGALNPSPSFAWVGSDPALITFGAATALEIAAYYVPWVDNLLDTIASPAAVIAGTIAMATTLTDVHPAARWSLAIIAGGGSAAVVQGGTVLARAFSSAATGGLRNHKVSTLEAGTSTLLSLLAIAVPLLAAALVVLLVVVVVRKLRGRRRPPAASETGSGE